MLGRRALKQAADLYDNSTDTVVTDQESLVSWRRDLRAENLRPLIERYGALVYSSVYRQTGNADEAGEVTCAVFSVLARRAQRLPRNTVLAGWLLHITALACRKVPVKRRSAGSRRWFGKWRRTKKSPEATVWTHALPQIDHQIDHAIDRLPVGDRDAVLLRLFLNYDWETVARILGVSEAQACKRVERALKKLARRLGLSGKQARADALAHHYSANGCGTPLPQGLALTIQESLEIDRAKRPALELARLTLKALSWARWRRRLFIGAPIFGLLLAIMAGIAWHIDSFSGHSRLISAFIVWRVRFQAMRVAESARRWPTTTTSLLDARFVRSAEDLYHTTNIWLAHLTFTRPQWKALEPRRIEPLPNFLLPDGLILLRNPKAPRSGLAGVLGYAFDWTHAEFEFGGVGFRDVAARVKGNAGSLVGPKHSFKVDLNRFVKGQTLGGLDQLTFNNLIWDYSYLSDALAYEFFRDAGVPAPRTAYAWLTTSVTGQWDRKPLGLYVMVEPVEKHFVHERFGSRQTPVFKPVTYELFKDLGDDWSAYAAIYDPKTEVTPNQQRRLIEFARLVSSATDVQFDAQLGDFLDLDEFARFLASEVLISSYDSLLTTGQNFYMYLDLHSNKFGFVPWDLDSAWGDFWIGTRQELERASIWHPWVGQNRFLERCMASEQFRQIYRARLEDFLTRLFAPDRLQKRVDELAQVLRSPITAESAFRLNKFEQVVGGKPVQPSPGETAHGLNHPAYPIKRFIEARSKSVRQQLDGKSAGIILKPPALK